MDKLIISGEGFPGTNELLQFQHDTPVKALEGIAKALGNNVIVSGMQLLSVVEEEENVSDGWLIRNNELLPFVGGEPEGESVVIIEETTESGYDTQGTLDFTNVQPVWKKRWCKFGTMATPGAVSVFPYTDLTRLSTLAAVANRSRFLRKGRLDLNYVVVQDQQQATVTGNFTGVETPPDPSMNVITVKVSFPEVAGDYFPLVIRNNQNDEIPDMPFSLSEKTPSSITLVFRRPNDINDWWEVNSQSVLIYLLG